MVKLSKLQNFLNKLPAPIEYAAKSTAFNTWLMAACAKALPQTLMNWGDRDNNYRFFRDYSETALKIAGVKLDAKGMDHLEHTLPVIFVVNHQSSLDLPVLGMFFPHRTVGLGKRELLWIPFFGLYFAAAGNFLVNRKSRESGREVMEKAAAAVVKEKLSVGFFAEGTRNKKMDGFLPFKTGAFRLAILAQVPIFPIVIQSQKHVFDPNAGRIKPGILKIRGLGAVQTKGMKVEDSRKLAEQIREQMLKVYEEISK